MTVAGQLMDRSGRRVTALLGFAIKAVGLVLLALASSVAGFAVASITVGIGGALLGGVTTVLGQDMAPPTAEAGVFLGIYQSIGNLGSFGGPMLVGCAAHVAGTQAAALFAAGLAVSGLAVYASFVPETLES